MTQFNTDKPAPEVLKLPETQPLPMSVEAAAETSADQYRNRPDLYRATTETSLNMLYDLGSWAIRKYYAGPSDPNWVSSDPNQARSLIQGMPFEFWDDILDSPSATEAEMIRKQVENNMAAAERVQQAYGTIGSIGINLVGGIAEFAPVMVMTGGVGSLAAFGAGGRSAVSLMNAARVAKSSNRVLAASEIAKQVHWAKLLAYGGIHGTVSGLAYVGVDSVLDPTIEGHDFRMAALMGAGLGAAANRTFGRSVIKGNMLRMSYVYDDMLYAADKTYLARFGAEGINMELSRRFGISVGDANAFLVAQRALTGNPDLSFADIALAGPKTRLRRGQTVLESYRFGDNASVEMLNDGKVIIRALEKSGTPAEFIEAVGGIIARRIVGEDNPELTNSMRIAFDRMVRGLGPSVRRKIPLTVGVEAGKVPSGMTAAEVHLGTKLTPNEVIRAKASPWTPKISEARNALKAARDEFDTLYRKIRSKYSDILSELDEVDAYDRFLSLERSGDPDLKRLQSESRKLSAKIKKFEKSISDVEERDLRYQVEAVLGDRKNSLKTTRAELNRLRKEYNSKKKASTEERKALQERINKLAEEEEAGSGRLREAEEAMAELDVEYMILRRKEPYTQAEMTEFSNTFLAWLRNAKDITVDPSLIPVFEKVQEILRKMHGDGTDPRIAGAVVSPDVDAMFRQIYANTVSKQAAEAAAKSESASYRRMLAIANGVDVPPPEAKIPPTPGSKPKNFDDAPFVNVNVLGINITKVIPGLSRGIAAMNNSLGEIRWLGNAMMWLRVAPVDAAGKIIPQGVTVWEKFNRLRRVMESRLKREHDAAYHQYITGEKDVSKVAATARIRNQWKHESKERFSREIYEEIVNPGSSQSAAVKRAADGYRSHYTAMRKLADEIGLPGFAGSDKDGIYFPRLWRWDLIDAFIKSDEDVTRFGRMIRESIQIPVVASVDDPEFIAGRAITMEGRDALAMFMAEKLRFLARDQSRPEYLNIDEIASIVLNEQGNNTNFSKLSGGPYLTPRGRRRLPMDVSKVVDIGEGKQASLIDFLEIDVGKATDAYNRSVFGAMMERQLVDDFRDELVARGLREIDAKAPMETFSDVVAYLRNAGKYTDKGDLEAGIDHLTEIMAGMRSEPIAAGEFTKIFSPLVGRLQKYAYLRNGFAFGLASINEFGRVLGRTSVGAVLKQMPIFNELRKAAKAGKIDAGMMTLLSEIDGALGTGTDRLRRAELGIVDSRINSYAGDTKYRMWRSFNKWADKNLDPNLNQATVLMSDLTGLAPITTASQHMMTASLIQEVFDKAATGKQIYSDTLLAQWGVTRAEFDAIRKELRKNATVNSRGRVVATNFEKWNQNTASKWLDFLERATVSSIQDPPTRGDFSKAFWTPMGRLLFQFKTFNIKGINNFLMTSIQRKDARVFQEYAALSVLGLMTQMARKVLYQKAFGDEKERQKYFEENLSTQAMINYALSGPTENYLLLSGVDTISQVLTGDTVFSKNVRYSGLTGGMLDLESTPAGRLGQDAARAVRGVVGSVISEKRDFSHKDLHAIRSLLPMNKMLGINNVLNAAESGIGDYFELPQESTK
jgi:hypothetical protein